VPSSSGSNMVRDALEEGKVSALAQASRMRTTAKRELRTVLTTGKERADVEG